MLKGVPAIESELARELGASSPDYAVSLLATAFVAWVLQNIRARLDEELGADNWKPLVRMSAPMDRTDDVRLMERYLAILHAACVGVFGTIETKLDPRWELQPSLQRLTQLLASPLPDEGERMFDVLAETVAGMVPVSKDRNRGAGIYNVIDIGGGSTEVSIVYLAVEGRRVIDCKADESVPTGSMAIRALSSDNPDDDPLARIRQSLVERWMESYLLDAKNKHRPASARRSWERT